MAQMTMTIERVTTFMGLDVLVATDALSPDDFGPFDATTQINRKAEREAHERASAVLAG